MATILDTMDTLQDLRGLNPSRTDQLAAEIRSMIIGTVAKTGGHLASNLGVVELTIALLKTFEPPQDKILWDVSHQTYAYKILTDRRDRFATLRQENGLSGFLRRDESPFDAFGAGHGGTALSAALGMAVARNRRGGNEHVVAIIGDGALGCGISYEALNNISSIGGRFIVILNDNEMSISQNVGAMSRYLGKLLASPRYNRWKSSIEGLITRRMRKPDLLRRIYYRIEEGMKNLFLRSVVFEELGLRYIGPIDGHDTQALLAGLTVARQSDRPILVHVATQKGKGYSFAEQEPERWHGPAPFDPETGKALAPRDKPSYSEIFGRTLARLAEQDDHVVAITAAMAYGTGLSAFAKRFPDRFFDVGMSEEHAVVFAAGLAAEGLRPVATIYSTFIQRAVDCIIHDVCLQKLPVVLCLDRAGIVGEDGPTHHGVFDIALLAPIPNLIFMQPKDETELANMLFTALQLDSPVAIRYPRGAGSGASEPDTLEPVPVGKANIEKDGSDIQLWALGDMVPLAHEAAAMLAADGLSCGVVNARFVRPLDTQLLQEQAADARLIATLENGVLKGGFGDSVTEHLVATAFKGRILRFGWPDAFIPHAPRERLMSEFGLTANAIVKTIREALSARERQ